MTLEFRSKQKIIVPSVVVVLAAFLLVMTHHSGSRLTKNTYRPQSDTVRLSPIDSVHNIPPRNRLAAKDEGVVFTHGQGPDGSDGYGARDVWVWEDHGTYYMHYDGAGEKGWLTCLATGNAPTHWKAQGTRLALGDSDQFDGGSASYGVTYYDTTKSKWYMFYLAATIVSDSYNKVPSLPYVVMHAVASKPSGPWTKISNMLSLDIQPWTFFSASASPGQVIKHNGEYLMFFSGSQALTPYRRVRVKQEDGSYTIKVVPAHEGNLILRSIGIARTPSLDSAWKADTIPAIPNSEQVENASLYFQQETNTWFLFANHVRKLGAVEYTDAIWVYWSHDLEKWDVAHKAVVLDGSNCTWSKYIIGLPSVIKVGKRLAIYYDGYGGSNLPTGTDVHMKRDIGLAWLDLPIKVTDK